MEWIDRLAQALAVEAPDPQQTTRLLAASREVAHFVERKTTPLAAYVLGSSIAAQVAGGASPDEAFDDALSTLLRMLPEAPPGDGADR